MHSTGHDPHGKLLARANACACLRELQSFGRGEGYPGDADMGLPDFAADIPPFDAIRVVHLGDGLNQEELGRATENVAQFLDLATATPGGVFFDSDDEPECRRRPCGPLACAGSDGRRWNSWPKPPICFAARRPSGGWVTPGADAAGRRRFPAAAQPGSILAQVYNLVETRPETDSGCRRSWMNMAPPWNSRFTRGSASQGGVLAAQASAPRRARRLERLLY